MNQDKKYQKALNNLYDSFNELIHQDIDFAKEILIENGDNPAQIEENGLAFIKKLQAKAKITLSKQKSINLFESAKAKLLEMVPNPDDLKVRLSELLNGSSSNGVIFNFNSLKELSQDDLLDMINEAQLLELLEELKNKEQ